MPSKIDMNQTISLNRLLDAKLKKMKDMSFLERKTLLNIGNIIVNQIKFRTREGEGADEQGNQIKFKAYNAYYKKIREKQGLPTSPVDLTVTGEMLESVKVKNVSDESIIIGLQGRSKELIGKWRGATEGIKRKDGLVKRPFLNLNNSDIKEIKPEIIELIKKDYEKAFKKGII